MKEITKERTQVQKYTVYVANDGTEFNNPEECKKYDDSAIGVLRAKIAKLIVGKGNAWEVMGGYDDHEVIAIKMHDIHDLDTVKQFFLVEHPYYATEEHEEAKNAKFAIIDKAFKDTDCLLFGINCEGEYYFINSVGNIISNFQALTNN